MRLARRRRATASKHPRHGQLDALLKANIKNVVVIYLENRSFNNLYGNFPGVAQPLSAVRPEQALQRDRDGQPLSGLPKIWGGLVPTGQTVAGKLLHRRKDIHGLPNAPFPLKDAEGQPLPEAVITRDLCHLFYHNQMQINDGRNDQFVALADSGALVMGHYPTPRAHSTNGRSPAVSPCATTFSWRPSAAPISTTSS